MNKKHLSVVMAGAMLATSVAPVLAADAVTVKNEKLAYDQRGLLMESLRNLANEEENIFKIGMVGESIYGIKKAGSANDVDYSLKAADAIKEFEAGDKVEIYKHKSVKDSNGNLSSVALKEVDATEKENKLETEQQLKELAAYVNANEEGNVFLDKAEEVKGVDGKVKEVVVTLNVIEDVASAKNKTITYTIGSEWPEFKEVYGKDGLKLDISKKEDVQKFDHFGVYTTKNDDAVADKEDLGADLIATVELTKENNDSNLLVEDLFDGLLLTEKGNEFADAIKATKEDKNNELDVKTVLNHDFNTTDYGLSSFTITVTDKDNKVKTITVRGLDKENAKLLQYYLDGKKQAEVLAGSNRYETAAKIAKEQCTFKDVKDGKNIVLVNGNALVDGLAAAPFAASKGNAPVLLTEANGLPKATKAYLKELMENVTVGALKDITINLIGGDAVLSQSLVDELEGYGFTVERFGGDNREETSLEVARAIEGRAEKAFVVGANGEADAMSIAPVAAEKKAPIIVTKSDKGLSKEALRTVKNLNVKDVTIVGGEAVVPAATETAIEEAKIDKSVERVFGANRKATNAAIIEKYYKDEKVDAVMVAKDGQNNKSELVDALTAANLAVQKNAPIVLATNKLSNEQINQLNLNAPKAEKLFQLGGGVERTVLNKVAQLLGLPKSVLK